MATKSGWTVEYASKAVEREMLGQHKSIKADFIFIKHTIETRGLDAIPHKLKEKIRNNLWELRLTGKKVIARALYLQKIGDRIIIVHVFTKKSQHIPERHIKLALKRAKEFENAQSR